MKALSLHIGLNKVFPGAYGGWSGILYGCINDAMVMMQIAHHNKFQTSILLDEEATIQRVLDALHVFASDTQAGDTVLISYSGHGGQVYDDSGDENDQLDETMCLYDGMLLDDHFHRALSQFKKGVRVIVTSDSCHSGTIIRETLRPGWHIKVAPEFACREAHLSTASAGSKAKRPKIKASVILLSGCQDNQVSYDGKQNGLFTEKLHRIYEMQSFKGDYPSFRKAVVKLMPPDQTPQMLLMGASNKAFVAGQVFATL